MEIKMFKLFILFSLALLVSCNSDIDQKEKNNAMPYRLLFDNKLNADIVTGLVATHCTDNETTYMNASMEYVNVDLMGERASSLKPANKVMSICAAEDNKQINYRYGRVGAIELTKTANVNFPFGRHSRLVNNINESILFFTKHGYHYYVVYSADEKLGVSIKIYDGNLLISEQMSGREPYQDFVVTNDANFPRSLLFNMQPPHIEMR
jgi:hypothetical protein